MQFDCRKDIVQLTPEWEGERFDNGRPRVPDGVIRRMERVTTEEAWAVLWGKGYKYQFVTLAGFHSLNASMFELARGYSEHGMAAYSALQDHEFLLEEEQGYRAVRHQSFVGAGYFDQVTQVITSGKSSLTAMHGSTEEEQFQDDDEEFTQAAS